ncbi:FAD-binding oxidoreductase [Nitratireductor mangrovi]|uniref:FAD-binding oxidoreductase n=1 Tax=Nitratireductor mangrovi TaxID=2599600 RepID=A0A5B8L4V3_9HYPH|nr:FAD-binding oxidoreductase [Nitratireductor mangrovi]QDZ02957.1 FAD-binding oxidoreductase [Nitratireductor mangrovi]
MGPVLESFGRTFAGQGRLLSGERAAGLLARGEAKPASLLGYGNGRSYGDSCLNAEGSLIDMRGMARILSFDPATGLLEAEAGAQLSDIIAHAAPHGYLPAVLPGTQWVTLGGAIANDIHGKNHHRRGTFGAHVERLTLLRSDGRALDCSPSQNSSLFRATIGGLGLTGLISRATVRLMRVPSLDIAQGVTPFADLDAYFDLAERADAENEYAVAWIDQLAEGRHAGRGLLLTGNHAEAGARSYDARPGWLSVPLQPPFSLLSRPALKLFNAAYRYRTARSAGVVGARGFFFPLDGVSHWNRLYGPRGLHQHQSVIPLEAAREAIPALLAATRKAGQGSFLTVLKRFGDRPSPAAMSFPRPGYTLTLDFPALGERTLALLSELDRITVDAGGAVNPYKDARMSAEVFAASFPTWRAVEQWRDPAFMSDFWRRTAMRLAADEVPRAAAE